MTRRILPFLVLVNCLVAGTAFAQADRLQLGKNLGGEICRIDSDPVALRSTDIFCGDNVQSVGRLQVEALNAALPVEAVARRQAIRARADSITAMLSISGQLTFSTSKLGTLVPGSERGIVSVGGSASASGFLQVRNHRIFGMLGGRNVSARF